jgi:hypothetical protein
MPRELSPTIIASLTSGSLTIARFVQIVFANETLYLWSGLGTITPQGPAFDQASSTFPYDQAFTGLGWLGTIASIPSSTEVIAENITLLLSGIPTELLGDAVNSVRLTGSVQVWDAVLDSSGNVIPDPWQIWDGETDVPATTEDGGTCTIAITAENSMLSLNLSSNRRYTDADQQLDSPGDVGFAYVTAMQDLYLPYPDGTLATTNVVHVGDAPAWTIGITMVPTGPVKLEVSGTSTQAMAASAYFQTGPHAGTVQVVTHAGLWSSSDNNVATVTNGTGASGGLGGSGGGLITAIGPGNCTITFFYGNASYSFTVQVTP